MNKKKVSLLKEKIKSISLELFNSNETLSITTNHIAKSLGKLQRTSRRIVVWFDYWRDVLNSGFFPDYLLVDMYYSRIFAWQTNRQQGRFNGCT